jgi:hypothetical protein
VSGGMALTRRSCGERASGRGEAPDIVDVGFETLHRQVNAEEQELDAFKSSASHGSMITVCVIVFSFVLT